MLVTQGLENGISGPYGAICTFLRTDWLKKLLPHGLDDVDPGRFGAGVNPGQ